MNSARIDCLHKSGGSGEKVTGWTGMEMAAKGKSAGQRRLMVKFWFLGASFLTTAEKLCSKYKVLR